MRKNNQIVVIKSGVEKADIKILNNVRNVVYKGHFSPKSSQSGKIHSISLKEGF